MTSFFAASFAQQALVTGPLPKDIQQKVQDRLQAGYLAQQDQDKAPSCNYGQAVEVQRTQASHLNFASKKEQSFILQASELKTSIYFDENYYDIRIKLDDKKNLDITITPHYNIKNNVINDSMPIGKLNAKVTLKPHSVYSNLRIVYLDIHGLRPACKAAPEELLRRRFAVGMIFIDVSKMRHEDKRKAIQKGKVV